MCFGGGGGSDVEYTQSPEQQQLMKAYLPMAQGMGQYGEQRYFGGADQMGAPSMAGVLTGQQMYDIPDPSMAMPTQNWWNSISPEVKAGLYAPYEEAGQGMLEMMGSRGQTGSAGSGYTGAAGAAMGELAGEAAKNVGLSAWQMTSPMAMNAWNASLNRNISAYGAGQQERLGDYQTEMQVWNRPYESMMGMTGMSMPQAYTQQGRNQVGGALSGAMTGGMGMYGMTSDPYMAAAGAVAGGLAGYYS
jgi:hypothetical protein